MTESSQETFRQLQKFVQRKRQFEQRAFKRRQNDANDDDDVSELDKLEQELVDAMTE
jgi:hypothetical protein